MTIIPGFPSVTPSAALICSQQPISVSSVADLHLPDDDPVTLSGRFR